LLKGAGHVAAALIPIFMLHSAQFAYLRFLRDRDRPGTAA